jgi:hypothetical protein
MTGSVNAQGDDRNAISEGSDSGAMTPKQRSAQVFKSLVFKTLVLKILVLKILVLKILVFKSLVFNRLVVGSGRQSHRARPISRSLCTLAASSPA